MPTGKRDAEEVRIVLAVYDPKGTYARHAGVLMTSVFLHTERPVHVTLLHDTTLNDANRLRLRKTAERFSQKLSFLDVSERIARIGIDPDAVTREFSRGSLYRLMIPDVLPVGKVLYLDCDVAVNGDIAELWDLSVDGVSLAAAKDVVIAGHHDKLHEKVRAWAMGYDGERYFNSGVLLMNLDRIRAKHDLLSEATRFFKRYRHCADMPDQDFLNRLFHDDLLTLDGRFNLIEDSQNIENAVLHLTGKYKPWVAHRSTPRDYFYWKMFAESEWRDQLVDALLEVYKNNPVAHLHTAACRRRILGRWGKDLLRNNFLAKTLRELSRCLTELRLRAHDVP